MSQYELNDLQREWVAINANTVEFLRFVIHGPVDVVLDNPGDPTTGYIGRLRGIEATKPVCSMALALKEAEAIRSEYIQAVGMIPLDEEALGIADTSKQRTAA